MNLTASPGGNIFSPKMRNVLSYVSSSPARLACHGRQLQALIDFCVCFPTAWFFALTVSPHNKAAAPGRSGSLLLCFSVRPKALWEESFLLGWGFSASAQVRTLEDRSFYGVGTALCIHCWLVRYIHGLCPLGPRSTGPLKLWQPKTSPDKFIHFENFLTV